MKKFVIFSMIFFTLFTFPSRSKASMEQKENRFPENDSFSEETTPTVKDSFSQEEITPEEENNDIPQKVYTQARVLTDHFIHYVMREDWLDGGNICEENIFRFLLSLYVYKEDENHPYCDYGHLSEDGWYFLIKLSDAQKIANDFFAKDSWSGMSYPSELFDEATETYKIPVEAGIWTSDYSFDNMEVSHVENSVKVNVDIINSSLYEYEECNYGTYTFFFEYITVDGDSYLQYRGIERQS